MSFLWLLPAAALFIPELCCTDNVFILSPPHRSENNFDMELELEALLEVRVQSCCTCGALDLSANGFAIIIQSCPSGPIPAIYRPMEGPMKGCLT